MGKDEGQYRAHSFRIGAASAATFSNWSADHLKEEAGMSSERYNFYKRYVMISSDY